MDKYVLKNVTVDGMLTDITIDRGTGKILSVEKTADEGRDMMGSEIIPGFVDIHSHGCVGYDTMDGDKLPEMSKFLAEHGTTSWCPTTMTLAVEDIRKVVASSPMPTEGAHVVGFHLEGPYIAPKYCGAQRADLAKAPDLHDFEGLDNVALLTLAPELEGAMDYIKNAPFPIALGHTAADFETAQKAFQCGANCVTHTFNAMPPLHHREPSVIGAALVENAYAQVICDGKHIHPAVILALYRMFGPERMILISDSMRATGLPDGLYELGGQPVIVKESTARTESGALAGSTSTLAECVRCAVKFGIPRADAIKMATKTPAEYLGIRKGRIAPGYDADLLVVDDALNIKEVILCNSFQ